MMPDRSITRLVLYSLLTTCAVAQVVPPPPATDDEKKPGTQMMEAFTVTGSNIRRIDEEKTLPVTVMNLEDLDLRGATTPAELFDTLSIGGPIVLDEGNTLGADARGDNN